MIEKQHILTDSVNEYEDGKPYYSLNSYYHRLFGEKVYKIAIDGGFTCPNRDGSVGTRGCIFCSARGSGDFAGSRSMSVSEQIDAGKSLLSKKQTGHRYIAYFQAFTNTYAPVDRLRALYFEAVSHPEIAGIAIATRPDCLSPEIIMLLHELNQHKPVFVELGLQTIHETTAVFIRRGYPLSCYNTAVSSLRDYDIPVITHVILGLPGETKEDCLQTIRYISHQDIQGVKLQLLHLLKGTDLADYYSKKPFPILGREEYLDWVVSCVELLRRDIVIHRLTGDGPRNLLLLPEWSLNKRALLNDLHKEFARRDTWQGKYWAGL